MERRTTIEKAKTLYKENFIGIKELQPFFRKLDIPAELSQGIEMPDIPYSTEELNKYAKDYILILGIGKIGNINLSIRFIRDKMGINPEISEPCFYNQDWYLKENFIDTILENKWYLIRKNVFEETRAMQPNELIEKYINTSKQFTFTCSNYLASATPVNTVSFYNSKMDVLASISNDGIFTFKTDVNDQNTKDFLKCVETLGIKITGIEIT